MPVSSARGACLHARKEKPFRRAASLCRARGIASGAGGKKLAVLRSALRLLSYRFAEKARICCSRQRARFSLCARALPGGYRLTAHARARERERERKRRREFGRTRKRECEKKGGGGSTYPVAGLFEPLPLGVGPVPVERHLLAAGRQLC